MKRFVIGFALTACFVAPALAAQPSSFNVFFAHNNAQLTPDASAIVATAAKAIRHQNAGRIIVSAGDPRFAEARFHSVQTALVAGGVNPDRIARANLATLPIAYDSVAADRVTIQVQGRHEFQTAMVPTL